MRVLLLVGTETGNAGIVAETVEAAFAEAGHDVQVIHEGARTADIGGRDAVLVCTSSHGSGDIPDTLLPFCEALADQAPDLDGLPYGVIALGDRNYAETFCGAGKKVDALFARLKARALLPRIEIDANEHPIPDEVALEWALTWLRELEGRCTAAVDTPRRGTGGCVAGVAAERGQ